MYLIEDDNGLKRSADSSVKNQDLQKDIKRLEKELIKEIIQETIKAYMDEKRDGY